MDDTGFPKKGTGSARVQRQYSGTTGRTENCRVGDFLASATDRGRTLNDRRLYLPTSRTHGRESRRRAGINDEVAFETKVAVAKVMVRRAIADKIPFRWVTADAAYGFSKSQRSELEQADAFHVMTTTRHDTVATHWRRCGARWTGTADPADIIRGAGPGLGMPRRRSGPAPRSRG